MIVAGHYYTLTVNRISDFGLYLVDLDDQEVLLPNRYVSIENKVGDEIDVFVYHDSEDRLVATTETPIATVGEVASLRVVDRTAHGAFLDWGIPAKDLFLPNRNQMGRVAVDEYTVVRLYTDNITGRVVATNNLKGVISNEELTIEPREEVEVLLAVETPLGFRAVINNRHWGMLYRNQIFKPVAVGDRMKAYVTRITEDARVDLSLQQPGYDEVKRTSDRLLALMQEQGGSLPVGDRSAPEQIYNLTGISKKLFKRSVGYLLKNRLIEMSEEGITLLKK